MKKYSWILLVLVLVGCGIPSKIDAASTTIPSPLGYIVTPTMTKPPIPTPTVAPTMVSDNSIATPHSKQKSQITLELLRTNNGCELPCWWGIIPNQTSWSDAETFLEGFSTIYERQPPTEWFVYDVNSPLQKEYSEVSAVRSVYAVRQRVVKEIETGYFDEESYHIPELLSRVGKPSNIYVLTYRSDYGMPPGKVPFTVAFYYPEKGIMATYATDADVEDSIVQACIKTSPSLFLWSPTEAQRSLDYILGWDKHREKYASLEDATGLTISEFYETYNKPNASVCLQTQTDLWPSQ